VPAPIRRKLVGVSRTLTTDEVPSPNAGPPPGLGSFLLLAIWFAIIAGLVEGLGLLLFQRINWARWGPTLHVSEPIIWISPIVDLILFCVLTVALWAAGRLVPKLRLLQAAIALLTALTLYDWLTVTARLSHLSCLLLAAGVGVAFSRWVAKHDAATLQFVRRTFPFVAGAALLAFAGIQGGHWLREAMAVSKLPTAAADAPNVLVIVVDTLRADHLSSYGYARPTTPNIDRVATQGVLFENAVATSSWTFPSHASLLTGRYQYEHGMDKIREMPAVGGEVFSANGLPTLGEALMQKGYRTGAFSANRTYFTHDLGFGRGFVHFEDYFHSASDMFVRTLYGREFARIYLKRSDRSLVKRVLRGLGFTALLDQGAEGSGSYGGAFGIRKRADVINRETLSWIDRDRGRPFFVFLNYFDVHDPYGGPRGYAKPSWPQLTNVDAYDDGVKYVDDYIGRLMDELDRRGLAKNTLVVITGDHGESLGQHHLRTHGKALYWELIHVPLVLRYPGHAPAGIRLDVPVTNSVLPATIMELLGERGHETFPGPSLSALWQSPPAQPAWPDALSEVAKHNIVTDESKTVGKLVATTADGPMKSVVTTRWHLIVHKELGDQIYDWVHDPGETNNLIFTPLGQQAARELNEGLEALLARSAGRKRAPTSIALRDGRFNLQQSSVHANRLRLEPLRRVDDYYHMEAHAGSTLVVDVSAQQLAPAVRLDPVIAIVDEDGKPYQSCRNPGDDHTQEPGVADPTPDAFDDICVNDDINPGVNTDARLEILVPDGSKSLVELNIRVSDWNGQSGPGLPYQMQVQEAGARPESARAANP
jgi:arylsulfatase A-like enzyme